MAAILKPHWLTTFKLLGDDPFADGTGLLFKARNISTGLQAIRLDRFMETPPSTFVLQLAPVAALNNNTVKSAAIRASFPFQIGQVQGCCTSAAGTAATADLLVGDTVAGAATVLGAPVDIKTGTVTPEVAYPEVDSDLVAEGQYLVAEFIGTGVGAVVGATLWVYGKRI